MEQNLGPHMEQKWAVLAGSWGSVASCAVRKWGGGGGGGGRRGVKKAPPGPHARASKGSGRPNLQSGQRGLRKPRAPQKNQRPLTW
jgi:hypothetical protein